MALRQNRDATNSKEMLGHHVRLHVSQSAMKTSRIVVGVDGSPGSHRALAWALQEGARRQSMVDIVTVVPSEGERSSPPTDPETTLADAVASAQGLTPDSAPPMRTQVATGTPADVLTRLAADADMLVVASHATTGIRREALGSTSEWCTRFATCPVVVIPKAFDPTTRRRPSPPPT